MYVLTFEFVSNGVGDGQFYHGFCAKKQVMLIYACLNICSITLSNKSRFRKKIIKSEDLLSHIFH